MIIKCSKGHWYDAGIHKTCPHCQAESEKLSIRLDDIEEDDRTISIAEADLSLGEELGAIIGNTISKPIPGEPREAAAADGDKTISFGFFGITSVQPVTGWLVCMTGDERGKDFRLHTGKNFVGRGTSMDVVLIDDKAISRDRHCSVSYDPKGNAFYLSSEGGNLVYLNDSLIETPVRLQEGDEICIGKTRLLFIPFCREGRLWERESD